MAATCARNVQVIVYTLNRNRITSPSLDNVFFSFHTHQAPFLGGRVGPAVQKILVVDNLCLNKSLSKSEWIFPAACGALSPL